MGQPGRRPVLRYATVSNKREKPKSRRRGRRLGDPSRIISQFSINGKISNFAVRAETRGNALGCTVPARPPFAASPHISLYGPPPTAAHSRLVGIAVKINTPPQKKVFAAKFCGERFHVRRSRKPFYQDVRGKSRDGPPREAAPTVLFQIVSFKWEIFQIFS